MPSDVCPKCGSAERSRGVAIAERFLFQEGPESSVAADPSLPLLNLGWLYPHRIRVCRCRKCGFIEHYPLGGVGFQSIGSFPEKPTPDDVVTVKVVAVAFAVSGMVTVPREGLVLKVIAWLQGNPTATHELRIMPSAEQGLIALGEGATTIELGKLCEGAHALVVDIEPPEGLEWKVQPLQGSQIVVAKK